MRGICPICKRTFSKKRGNHIFCRRICREIAYGQRHRDTLNLSYSDGLTSGERYTVCANVLASMPAEQQIVIQRLADLHLKTKGIGERRALPLAFEMLFALRRWEMQWA